MGAIASLFFFLRLFGVPMPKGEKRVESREPRGSLIITSHGSCFIWILYGLCLFALIFQEPFAISNNSCMDDYVCYSVLG